MTRGIIFQDPGVARTSSWSLPGGNRVISLSVPQAPPSFSPPSATQPATQCETMPHTLSATLVQCHTNDGRPCQCLAPLAHTGVVPNFLSVHRSPLCQRRPHSTIDRKKHTLWSATKLSGVVNRHNVFYRTFEKPHRCHQTAIVCSVFTPMWLFLGWAS